MNQFTFLRSAPATKPASFKAALSLVRPSLESKPSSFLSLMPITTGLPAGPFTEVKDRPDLVSASLARSHSVNFDHGPTKMWKLHCAGSAVTVILVLAWKASRSGFTAFVSAPNSGREVTAASGQ